MTDNIRRNRAYGVRNALQKLNPLPIVAQRNPTTSDRAFPIGIQWINQTTNSVYSLTSITNGLANWEVLGSTGSTSTTEYVVDAGGTSDYATIQSAINAANAAGVDADIYIKPGTYAEALTVTRRVFLRALKEGVIISGTLAPSATTDLLIQGCTLTSATDFITSAAAGTATITLDNCILNQTNGHTISAVNWTGSIIINNCTDISASNAIFDNTTGSADVLILASDVGLSAFLSLVINNSSSALILNSRIGCPIFFTGSSVYSLKNSEVLVPITTANTAAGEIYNSSIDAGASPAITHGSAGTLALSDVTINSSNASAIGGVGAGVITIGSVTFLNSRGVTVALTVATTGKILSGGYVNVEGGAAATSGSAGLVAGTITVNTTAVRSDSRILLTHRTNAGTPGFVSVTVVVAGTSFTITSANPLDISIISWFIVNPMF